jgi:hypothetical protein
VSEQRRRLERALRGCAERGAPADTVDLWPAVRERVGGARMAGTTTDDERGAPSPPSGARPRRALRPVHAPMALVLAALSVLILGLIVFAASGPVGELIENGPPGPGASGPGETTDGGQPDGPAGGEGTADRLFAHYLPGGEGTPPGEEIGQTKTADGAKVTLERAYADEDVVVVGIEARDLDGPQKLDGPGRMGPVFLQPLLVGEEGGNEAELPPRVDITDASGEAFTNVDGMTQYPGAAAVFEAPEGLEAGREHRFRLEVPLYEGAMGGEKPDAGPFVFDFEVRVQTLPVVEVGQEATKGGVTLTLERVVNSPSRPQAIVCFDPPNEDYEWRPSTAPTGFQREEPLPVQDLRGGCWSLTLEEPAEGRSSVTVTELFGYPRTEGAIQGDEDGKEIRGPWTFEFEAPQP